jgi:myo-inositol-1(or 4)-monophosphatase
MWKKELFTARKAAKKSCEVLNNLFGKAHQIIKKGEIDLVTEADLQSEEIIMETIRREFPQDSILTEESGSHDYLPNRVWLIDPLDGTTNFAHSFPFFAVSIALEIDKEIILGLVYNPCLGEYFEAVKGQGASLNTSPIQVSPTRDLKESLLATGFPYRLYEDPRQILDLFEKMIVLAQGIRRPGSAAIDLCYVAAGRLDGFWEAGLKPWDTAAGSLIVTEAGGLVTNYLGMPYNPFQNHILAANPFIHVAMLNVIKNG